MKKYSYFCSEITKAMKKISIILVAFWLMSVQQVLAQYTRVTNLPTIYIETFDGWGIWSKEDYKLCRMYYVDENDLVTAYDSVSIRGRGNSTWNMSKKPYKIKFNQKEKFLGKSYAKAKKWTLLANAGDKTMMRNAITSLMGEFTTLKFNPAAKFVDLYLNYEYLGTYQISDQVDVRPHRVNITEQPYPITDDTDISGGYLLEVDGFRDGNCFTSSTFSAPVRIHYPEDDEIDSKQTAYIRSFINNKFEKALISANFDDPEVGYKAYVDTTSLLDWYLCTEISANIDGFYSTYFYKEQGNDHLFWGPLWDYDIAYNNDYRVQNDMGHSSSVNKLMVDIAYTGSKAWVIRMWKDDWFKKAVYRRYQELLNQGLVDYMHAKVDSLSELLQQSQELNYEKWGINRRMYHEVVLYSSYDQYVSDLKQFITEHCQYLTEAFFNRLPDEPIPPFAPENFYYHIVNAKTQKAADLDGDLVVQMVNNNEKESQDWEIQAIGSHFRLLNRLTGKALNDPTEGEVGPTTNVGTQLNTVEPDEHSESQQWDIIAQGNEGYFNLLNVYTQHIVNLNGGSSNDYTALLSYTNDEKNATSTNRLWYLIKNGELPEPVDTIPNDTIPNDTIPVDTIPTDTIPNDTIPDGIEHFMEPADYALAYNPQTKTLHFGSATPELLTFPVRIFNTSGRLVGMFRADEQYSMETCPKGVYIATWNVGGRTRSVKFKR